MLKAIREAKRVVQYKQVAYCPNLFKAVIIKNTHPTEYDESDDLELIKKINNIKIYTIYK